MQAEGEVMRLPTAGSASSDFRTFFEDEHRRLLKTLYFVTGDRAEAADLWTAWTFADLVPEELRGLVTDPS